MEESQLPGKREQGLHEAALNGDIALLNQILDEDPLILRRVKVGCLVHTPLHVAAYEGKVEFVRALLAKNQGLARVLDPRRWSALHLAAAQGHCEIVRDLVRANPDMCATLDGDGRNPLHLAAMVGDVCVLTAFLEDKTYSNHELLKAKDSDGNTIFHLAVKHKRFEAVAFLVTKVGDDLKRKNVHKSANPLNTINECGYTALDILEEIKPDVPKFGNVKEMFQNSMALKASEVTQVEWLSKKRDALMVVASLIATMAFQAGVSPPGGVWQDNSPNNSRNVHRAGEAVMAYNYPDSYPLFLRANTIGFVASVSTILFLVTGWPFKKKFFMYILVLIICLTVISMAFTYASAITVITPTKDRGPLSDTIVIAVIAWCSVMALLLFAYTIRLLNRWLMINQQIDVWREVKKFVKLNSTRSSQSQPPSANGNRTQLALANRNGGAV